MNQFNGWINVYKPANISSFEVIRKIKKKFKTSKIGHAGTLDPSAEGILPIAIGKTTKLISLITDKIKNYEFEIKWGEQTTTDDKQGKIINISNNIPSKEVIEKSLINFVGNIMQKPPKVSAVKIRGKRAYKRFRDNELFETKQRIVRVYSLKFINQSNETISKFEVECGKGFYVRSLARDLGEFLNTKAHIYSLKRLKVGKFIKKNSILLDDLLKMSEMGIGIKGHYSSMLMLDDIPALEIDNNEMLEDISHGRKVRVDNLVTKPLIQHNKRHYFATNKGNVISLGEVNGVFFEPKKVLL